jgi:ribosome-associated protein
MSEGASIGGTEIAPGVTAPSVRVQFSRGGGPGGQNVNKLNTRAELWVEVESIVGMSARAKNRLRLLAGSRLTLAGEIHLVSEAQRSQESNRQEVFRRLREMIVRAKIEPKPRRRTRPTRASKERRLDQKRHRGGIKARRKGPGAGDE